MNIYIAIFIIIIMTLLYIKTIRKLKEIEKENVSIKANILNSDDKYKKIYKELYDCMDKINESNRKIALYSGILSEKLYQYDEKKYSDIVGRESKEINKNLNLLKIKLKDK